jgi:hypothetical protein
LFDRKRYKLRSLKRHYARQFPMLGKIGGLAIVLLALDWGVRSVIGSSSSSFKTEVALFFVGVCVFGPALTWVIAPDLFDDG